MVHSLLTLSVRENYSTLPKDRHILDVLPLQGRRILVAPLDWGLGHATRCMPVINMLRRYGAEVIIGGEGRSLLLLKAAYPDLEFVDLPPYNITYSHNSLMVWKTLVDTPRLLGVFKEEHEVSMSW